MATSHAQESGRIVERTILWLEDKEGFVFDESETKDLLRKAKERPIIDGQITDLKEQVGNLKGQLQTKDELLTIAEERRKIQEEKADFYKQMYEAEKDLVNEYAKMNERLQKQVERKAFWDTLKMIFGITVGAAIVAAF